LGLIAAGLIAATAKADDRTDLLNALEDLRMAQMQQNLLLQQQLDLQREQWREQLHLQIEAQTRALQQRLNPQSNPKQ
jgi:hypothetical protein